MSSSPPPRKFKPEPIETSSKSSRQQSPAGGEEKPKPRRFAPEPVETTTKSSNSSRQQSFERGGPRKFAPEPVETSSRKSSGQYRQRQVAETGELKPRKFNVQPVETMKKSSRDNKTGSQDDKAKSKPRRFAPQLMETSRKNCKDRFDEEPTKQKFSPQPMETTFKSNRKTLDMQEVPDIAVEDEEPRQVRKFEPDLIDTATRTRKAAGSKSSAINNKLKTEQGWELHAKEHRKHIGHNEDESSQVTGSGDGGVILAGRGGEGHMAAAQSIFGSNDLKSPTSPGGHRRQSSSSMRSHSFRMPELDTIESSESERESSASSVSVSPVQGSPLTTSDSSYQEVYKHATRRRESVDETFGSYLLQLEAKRMEQRMQEQALAAFPNSDFHEPVQHYVDEDKESDSMELDDRPTTWEGHEEFFERARRESTANWEHLEMQKHAEKMSEDRRTGVPLNREPTTKQSQSPWWNDFSAADADRELKSMQQGARPPMLGSDLRFPRCPSPEPARFDVTQGSTKLRNQMCYLTEHVESSQHNTDEGGLWANRSPQSTQSTGKGLWGGFCFDDGEDQHASGSHLSVGPPQGPTGLMTPRTETSNPFEASFAVPGTQQTGPGLKTPPAPGANHSEHAGHLDSILRAERELDQVMAHDYPDSFITQVFNYLSLGYPTLARRFDDELAKISQIPVAQLREDDGKAKTAPKGYIRLGTDFEGGGGDGMEEVDSVRWKALKRYIREWAKQEKDMVSVEAFGGFGTGARRGSWAL
ncbi:hypothetical protein MBLNU230_g5286t1 [Neophaeotheca triangularis]